MRNAAASYKRVTKSRPVRLVRLLISAAIWIGIIAAALSGM
ncbi:hypothetical protein [Thalassovita aquimarina]|nr:hypothetical protein [Thalassovita aquimarina]